MLRPRIPVNPLPTGTVAPLAHVVVVPEAEPRREPSLKSCEHDAPAAPARATAQLTPGSAFALAAGGGAVVLVVGAILVSMLLAVAITGVSVAVIAVVLRLLVKDLQKGR
ncbi:SpdD-like protein [Streptomyces sp. NPDC002209]|uniref:SpdD-like protein n=1 Tax=Streptomyces sp. NPDC002209 TaxID=3364638 RepID=UPI0036AE5251